MDEEAVRQVNSKIQERVSARGEDVPTDLLKMLSDLDWAIGMGDEQ